MKPTKYSSSSQLRHGGASIEVVLATAVALPLALVLLVLGSKMLAYAFAATGGLVTMPW